MTEIWVKSQKFQSLQLMYLFEQGLQLSTTDANSITLSLLRIFDRCFISSFDLIIIPLFLPPLPPRFRASISIATYAGLLLKAGNLNKKLQVHLSVSFPSLYLPSRNLTIYYPLFHFPYP
jgi:hypothetical protein